MPAVTAPALAAAPAAPVSPVAPIAEAATKVDTPRATPRFRATAAAARPHPTKTAETAPADDAKPEHASSSVPEVHLDDDDAPKPKAQAAPKDEATSPTGATMSLDEAIREAAQRKTPKKSKHKADDDSEP